VLNVDLRTTKLCTPQRCSEVPLNQIPVSASLNIVQEYHYHLGPVNTITFIEDGKMFVSTSDDKTLRVWELGIPVQVCCCAHVAPMWRPCGALAASLLW
jgi:pre-mRNA-processing factor 17